MLDALFKPKFYSKCKSRLKLINTRLETIGKKRKAVEKFLKKDIVDLLRNALDYNAYGRAEGFLVEQNMSFCYELVGKFANCVSSHVRELCKQRDCPDECKEAIQSLIYAAARFSDLPELRELRTLFTPKFGNALEPYISKEFVDKLRQAPPSKEMKIQLLHDLAQEFSIEWDSKGLEQRLHSPPLLLEDKTTYDPLNDHDDHMNNDVAVPKGTGDKQGHERNWHTPKGNEKDTLSRGRKDISDAYWRVQSSTDSETTSDNSSLDGRKACSGSLGSVSDNETEIKQPSSFSYKLVPPPYVKEKLNKPTVVPEKQVPRSVRRRPLKPPLYENTVSDSKTGGTDKVVDSSGKESEKVKGDSRDYEEKIMDGLLMHYSKKESPYESVIAQAAYPKAYSMQRVEYDKVVHMKQKSSVPLVRGISLPSEDTDSMETLKVHGRATSLVPQMLGTAGHVHPSLPEYDDLSARLAALRNTTQPA
ncbi:bile acid:Na+ symporter [Vigna unguiculata]|uniref:Bile acid:Na+ symporter n=1 Tax=Vigna unguiculata TaxID=3917 RepID=A0A4D6N575_VIGUN|nr:bile acid:Na+ symporter [Vigna unguiculata]